MVGGDLIARGWCFVYDFDSKADPAAQPRAGYSLCTWMQGDCSRCERQKKFLPRES